MVASRDHLIAVYKALFALLPDDDNRAHIILLGGAITPFRNDTDRELPFRQESNFYYLTGFAHPGAHFMAISQEGTSFADNPTSELFIPPIEPADLMWSVPPPSLNVVKETHKEMTNVLYPSALPEALAKLIAAFPTAMIHILPPSPAFPALYPDAIPVAPKALSADYLISALGAARLIKTPEEITAMRKANEISSDAHEVVMRLLGLGERSPEARRTNVVGRPRLPGEWLIEKEAEAEAVFVATCRRQDAVHQAYLPIVAASTRAATLHYCCNDKLFAWGPAGVDVNTGQLLNKREKKFIPQVLLIDAGCEWNCYASDITRTMPVGNGGKFTPEAREIYSLVLEMQKESIALLKPGVHWDAVQFLCHKILIKGFLRLGVFKDEYSEEELLTSGLSAAFFPHGVGHSIGLDVHDVPATSKPVINPTIPPNGGPEEFYTYLRLRLPLRENMAVTVEPGIYFSKHLLARVRNSNLINHEVLGRYEPVGGVRIEDCLVITAEGCEILTTVGKEVDWIERVCSGES